jgi:hypothetical protein
MRDLVDLIRLAELNVLIVEFVECTLYYVANGKKLAADFWVAKQIRISFNHVDSVLKLSFKFGWSLSIHEY